MKKAMIVAVIVFLTVTIIGGCGDELSLDDPVFYTGKLSSAVYSNNQAEGYQLTFEDGKTIFVRSWISPTFRLYGEGFNLGESYSISQTRSGEPYVKRTAAGNR